MNWQVIEGEAIEVMRGMMDASIDSVVTDPPYEFKFMGRAWDGTGVTFRPETWAEVYRLLKDGSRLLAFGGPRTYHRMACAIEDAGFLIEDCVMWIYGQGFPKHRSKLKPAYEPIVVARKGRASELNIDACRIGLSQADADSYREKYFDKDGKPYPTKASDTFGQVRAGEFQPNFSGRWPANVILDEVGGAALDEMSGTTRSKSGLRGLQGRPDVSSPETARIKPYTNGVRGHDDEGGASRFFYCPKASRGERGEGNTHPTVKPLALMRYLCRLVTPQGGLVFDPFTGSGTTGLAAIQEGFNFVGVERETEYAEVARRRIAGAVNHQPLFAECAAAGGL